MCAMHMAGFPACICHATPGCICLAAFAYPARMGFPCLQVKSVPAKAASRAPTAQPARIKAIGAASAAAAALPMLQPAAATARTYLPATLGLTWGEPNEFLGTVLQGAEAKEQLTDLTATAEAVIASSESTHSAHGNQTRMHHSFLHKQSHLADSCIHFPSASRCTWQA